MKLLDGILHRRRLVLATTLLLAVAGLSSWLTMPREEDPQFPHRDGLIVTVFPGADALTVERMVVEPLEEHLAEVAMINFVESTVRAGVAIQHVELLETIYDTGSAWDEVQEAIDDARREFPAGVYDPQLDDDLVSQEAIVYALVGSADPLALLDAAEIMKRELLSLAGVKEVRFVADPGEQITIEYDDATARRLGLNPRALGLQLAQRSQIVPGGLIYLGQKTANLRPQTELRSLEELRTTPILLPSGSSVPLGELAKVRLGPTEPEQEIMRWNGEPAIGVAVVPQDRIDRVSFGKEVREQVASVAARLDGVSIEEMIFQPDLVDSRLQELTGSLRLGIFIVAGILFIAMGLRLGLVVALVVPLVALGSIGIFAAGGGVLHQISIAALVIALGMLVDNAIVVVENIQYRLDQGIPVHEAAVVSVKELAIPLGTATGTTLAAFVPMLIAKGNTSDFTRTIPVMIMLSLTVSYLFAILVTPVLSELVLKPRPKASREGRFSKMPERIAGLAVRRSGWVLISAVLLMVLTVFSARWVEVKFFPASDRKTVIVELEMPEGTHIETTDKVAHRLESALLQHTHVTSVGTFVGRNGPKFYYNMLSRPSSPHRSMLVAETDAFDSVELVIDWVREWVRLEVPEVAVVARRLEQGPPIEAPVEIMVVGHDFEQMEGVADQVLAAVRSIEGTRDVRHDLSLGAPAVRFEIDDAAAARHGLARTDVAQALLGRTLGVEIGQYRVGEDPIPIKVRSSEGERFLAANLSTIDVAVPGGQPVPLEQVASLEVEWLPAAVHHKHRNRVVKVQAQLAEGVTARRVSQHLEPKLAEIDLPAGIRLELAGELEESGKANAAILQKMPLGLLLLLFFLLLEFNSFRRMAIIMATVPLAAVGVVPGLILSNQPFGFMSMLGVISLVGIVVNNAIVLLDVIETRRREGADIDQALTEAVKRRTRPILLTMLTTVAGLSPLAFSDATLWPPLAWAMISGLMASTVLTLLVIPALYKLFFIRPSWENLGMGRRSMAAASIALIVIVVGLVWVDPAAAASDPIADVSDLESRDQGREVPSITLAQAMEMASSRSSVKAAELRAKAASQTAIASRRSARMPTVAVVGDWVWRDRDYDFETPLGGFTLGERTSTSWVLQVSQPIFDPSTLLYGSPAAESLAQAQGLQARRLRQELAREAAGAWLTVLSLDAAAKATDAFVDSLKARVKEMEARVEAGRILEAEVLKVRLELESGELDQSRLAQQRLVAVADLARTLGLEGQVEPAWDGNFDRGQDPSLGTAISSALESRVDLQALEAQLRALELRAKAVKAERLPKLEAVASLQQSDGDPFRPDELVQGTLNVTWVPFAKGTRAPRRAALEAEAEALRADLVELRRGVELQVRSALAQIAVARRAVEVRERGVELAGETLRVEQERNSAGRSTTNDLLAAEAALRRQRTENSLARLELLSAWVAFDLALGQEGPDSPGS